MRKSDKKDTYSSDDRMNDILDKISKYGINSLSKMDKEFLDSYHINKQEEVHKKILKNEFELVFDDDFGFFRFEYQETIIFGDETHYLGILYVPDLILNNGKKIKGILNGEIIVTSDFQVLPEFQNGEYDVFEFCSGLEYELDIFLDYVIQRIEDKKRN
jgi:hypothetical protein